VILTHGENGLLAEILKLRCEAQEVFATRIAANIGYRIVPENDSYDKPSLEERVVRLEKTMAHVCPDKSDDI
jgi:hypothetical protein